jgi:hypothetical protein
MCKEELTRDVPAKPVRAAQASLPAGKEHEPSAD